MVLTRYEEYINSNKNKKEEIVLVIFNYFNLADNPSNRHIVANFINREKKKRETESKIPRETTIRDIILADNCKLFNKYWAAKAHCNDKINTILIILKKLKLKDDTRNKNRVIAYMCDEKERHESRIYEMENEEENANKIGDVILENGYHITYFTCNKKDKGKIITNVLKICKLNERDYRNRQKVVFNIHFQRDKLNKVASSGQEELKCLSSKKVVKQSVFKIVGEEMRLGNADEKLDKQLNNQPAEEQDTTCNVGKTPDDIIADTNGILPFFWNNDVFNDCENYPVL